MIANMGLNIEALLIYSFAHLTNRKIEIIWATFVNIFLSTKENLL